jgi:hypothetical protein
MEQHSQILGPIVALAAWTLIIMLWMVVSRFADMRRKGIGLKGRVGTRSGAFEGVLDDRVNWKSHNYSHLLEQPTLFYAVALTLAISGAGNGINAMLAWAYVGLRVLHSLVQTTVNVVLYRFVLWIAASFVLMAMTLHAALTVFHHL